MERTYGISPLLLIFLTVCGGHPRPMARPAAAEAGFAEAQIASGLPVWVSRGSALVRSDGRGVFYGVGAARGIRDAALLRTTADNRARAELGKVFAVFSAAVMKDYMVADGAGEAQAVQQAIKTAMSQSLTGVTVVDRYIAADGTMYALASLDLDAVKTAIAEAKASGAVVSHTHEVSVDDIFAQHAKQPPPPPRLLGRGDDQGGKPEAATSDARAVGVQPPWVTGPDPRYDSKDYLCAVGYGPERVIAENGGYAALAKVFHARAEAVSRDFMGAYAQTGAQGIELQSSEQVTQVSTDKILRGVALPELWEDKKASTIYVLACLQRLQASQALRSQIEALDEQAGTYLEQSRRQDKTTRVATLAQALASIVQREALNGELRIVAADGVGLRGPYSHADVAEALDAAVEALNIGIKVEGPHRDDLRDALVQGLTKRGYKVSDAQDANLDVLVLATTRVDDAGQGTGRMKGKHFAVGVIQVDMKNMSTDKIFASFQESRKEGSRSRSEAERLAIRKLSLKVIKQIGSDIDAKIRGGGSAL